MSRGGRGGGKRGPDLSWDDEEETATPLASNKPEEQFPPIELPVPRPVSHRELRSAKCYLRIRDRVRNGPYCSILDPSAIADEKTGKVLKRAGFDPFNDQEKYSAKYHKKKRAVPELGGRDYALKHFPHELWPLLDPRRKNPLWKSADIDIDAMTNTPRKTLKRKRDIAAEAEEEWDEEGKADDDGNDTDASDPLLTGTRRSRNSTKAAKKRRKDPTTKDAREKRGLDAEDEFSDEEVKPRTRGRKAKNKGSDDEDDEDEDNPDDDNNANENQDGSGDEDEDDGSAEDEPVDSEFEESDDGGGDDYNAENYFDTGEGDDDDGFAYGGGGGGDEDGGFY